MKAILEFNLPEDQKDFEITSNALNFAMVIWKIDQYLRNEIKYNQKDYEKVREQLFAFREEHNATNLIEGL